MSHHYWFTTAPSSIRHALNSEHVFSQHSNTYNHSNARLFSDLMKFSVQNETLSLKQLVCSVIEKNHLDQYQHNGMRNLHKDLSFYWQKYGNQE